jgi:hypothetical protein
VSTTPVPTLVRRQLGRHLMRLRQRAGKTQADVDLAKVGKRTKMWRLENGQVVPRPGDVRELCALYGATSEETELLVGLAYSSQMDAYWEEYGQSVVPDWFGVYADLEVAASSIVSWRPEVIEGLTQTERYTRELMRADPRMTPEDVEKRVQFRLQRQKAVLGRPGPPDLTVIQGHGSLSLQVGGPDVMAEQIEHLRTLHAEGVAEVLVLPPEAGAYPFLGAFMVLDFHDPDDPAFVYVEIPMGARYLERPSEVDEARWALGQIRKKTIPIEEYRP